MVSALMTGASASSAYGKATNENLPSVGNVVVIRVLFLFVDDLGINFCKSTDFFLNYIHILGENFKAETTSQLSCSLIALLPYFLSLFFQHPQHILNLHMDILQVALLPHLLLRPEAQVLPLHEV